MRISSFLIFVLCAGLLQAQQSGRTVEVVSPGELVKLRQERNQAFQDWNQSDVGLETDLLKAPPDVMRKRISDAREKRRVISAAQARYSEALQQRYSANLKLLSRTAQSSRGTGDLAAMYKQLLEDVGANVEGLDAEIKKIPASDHVRSMAMQRQRSSLMEQQNIILQQLRALGKTAEVDTNLEQRRLAAIESHEKVRQLLESQAAIVKEDGESWDRVYAKMDEEVTRNATVQAAAATAVKTVAVVAPKPVPVPPVAPTPPSQPPPVPAGVPSGRWRMVNPDAKKDGDNYFISLATLELTRTGDNITGSYLAVWALGPEDKLNASVRLSFKGKASASPMVLQLTGQQQGTIRLQWDDLNNMGVGYSITKDTSSPAIAFKDLDPTQQFGLTRQ